VTNTDIQRLLDEAVATLKLTTVGYAGHSAVWRANQTTAWWKGLDKIRQARAALDLVVPPPVGNLPTNGVSVGSLGTKTASLITTELDLCKEAGAQVIRTDIYPGNEPAFRSYDTQVRLRGMETMVVLFGTTGPVSAAYSEAFARAKGIEFPTVRLWEFANEPDLNGWTPEQYAASAKGFSRGLRAVRPDATLIVGALWKWLSGSTGEGADEWVRRMIAVGFPDCDLLSLHLYDGPEWNDPRNLWNQTWGPLPAPRIPIRQQLDRAGLAHVKLCSTENGGPVPKYTEAQQAAYVGVDFDTVAAGKLAFHCVYSMLDEEVPGFGMVGPAPAYTKRLSFATYKTRAGT
jgi:hypothetical protein